MRDRGEGKQGKADGNALFRPDAGEMKPGKRMGIDCAGEAADFLWRFYL